VCLFTERLPADIPDAGLGGCCDGSAMNGPRACTCWDPVYDQEQSLRLRTDLLPLPADPPCMCPDCAYRPGSPERSGDERQERSGDGELMELVYEGIPFYCHQGCLRVVRLVHPSGAVYTMAGDYRPPRARNDAAAGVGVPSRADGDPALICSGWFLLYQAWLRQLSRGGPGLPALADTPG
jgi:hypothetical protein